MVLYENKRAVSPGDVIVDRSGNEMIVVEILNSSTGDCYALYNGEVKLVNAFRSSRIVRLANKEKQPVRYAKSE
mgnify:CR=1 FL=1|tara:strand:- start:6877 stop:7098 length:222 start_codon:yes stop_codon:yes gene_type:complete